MINVTVYTFMCILTINVSGTIATRGQRIATTWSKVIYSLCNIIMRVLAHAQNSRQKASFACYRALNVQLTL